MTAAIYVLGCESTALSAAADRAREFIHAAKAPATLRAYRADWSDFEWWCSEHGLTCLPGCT